MMRKLKGLIMDEHGQGMTEYGLVLGIIAVAVVSILGLLRDEIVEMFNEVTTAVTGRSSGDQTPTP